MQNKKQLQEAFELIRTKLPNFDVNKTSNSIGSNVFFRFGKEVEVTSQNGKKSLRKEWSLWLGNTSWRLSCENKYIVGSNESPPILNEKIKRLLFKKFQSFKILSQFFDMTFDFEDGYRLTTFCRWTI